MNSKKTPFQKQTRKLAMYYLGNALMTFSTLFLIYLYFPIMSMYLLPHPLTKAIPIKGMFIQIPKISAQARVIENVDPWKEKNYLPKLHEGVALSKYSGKPGEGGTSYLFAHSSDYPWNITHYNTAFFRLNELNIGDKVLIFRDGKKYSYTIYDKKTVWPSEVGYLKKGIKNGLILQTCTPIGTDWQRLLLYAKEI